MLEEAKPAPAAPVIYNNDSEAAAALIDRIDPEPPKVPEKAAEAAPETPEEPEAPAAEEQEDKINFDLDAKIFDVEEVVEGGGKEVRKYSANELKAQRMMQADYQRKTAELARQREKISEESRQAVDTERKRFLDSAQSVQKALYAMAAQEFQQEGVDISNQFSLQAYMGKLAKEDPAKYVQMTNRLNEIGSTINLVKTSIDQEHAKAKQERLQEIRKKAEATWEALGSKHKGWSDETYNGLIKVAQEYGFKPDEIANPVRPDGTIPDGYIPALDHRFFDLLHDANAYRQQQKQQPIVEKKVAAAPKPVKAGAPAKVDNKQRQDEKMGRLGKTGRIDDAASVLESMMR